MAVANRKTIRPRGDQLKSAIEARPHAWQMRIDSFLFFRFDGRKLGKKKRKKNPVTPRPRAAAVAKSEKNPVKLGTKGNGVCQQRMGPMETRQIA